jgi:hypothetical protein
MAKYKPAASLSQLVLLVQILPTPKISRRNAILRTDFHRNQGSVLKTYTRAANDLDLNAVTHTRGSLVRNLTAVTIPIAALSFGAVYLKWRSVTAAGIVAAGLFVASAVSNVRFFSQLKRRQALKQNSSAVEVFEVSASRIFDIEHLGSNGPAFCFFVEPHKALLLVGQWLMECGSFPSDSFRVYRWADTKKPIRIESIGRPINAEHSTVRLRESSRDLQIELLDATPETLQTDLDRVLNRK